MNSLHRHVADLVADLRMELETAREALVAASGVQQNQPAYLKALSTAECLDVAYTHLDVASRYARRLRAVA